MVTDEASQETEDGDGDGEGPVPVDDHRHGPGAGEVVGDEEDEDQEESDNREQAGKPGERLTTERAHLSYFSEGFPYQVGENGGEDSKTCGNIKVEITNQQCQLIRGQGSHGPDV